MKMFYWLCRKELDELHELRSQEREAARAWQEQHELRRQERDQARAEIERLRNELESRPPKAKDALGGLWWAMRLNFERPERGAVIRNFQITRSRPIEDTVHRYRDELFIQIVVDTEEPLTPEELEAQMKSEGFGKFVADFLKDKVKAMERPASEVNSHLRIIEAKARDLGVPTEGRALGTIIEEIKFVEEYQRTGRVPLSREVNDDE